MGKRAAKSGFDVAHCAAAGLLAGLLIDGPADADPWDREALVLEGQKVGRLT